MPTAFILLDVLFIWMSAILTSFAGINVILQDVFPRQEQGTSRHQRKGGYMLCYSSSSRLGRGGAARCAYIVTFAMPFIPAQ